MKMDKFTYFKRLIKAHNKTRAVTEAIDLSLAELPSPDSSPDNEIERSKNITDKGRELRIACVQYRLAIEGTINGKN